MRLDIVVTPERRVHVFDDCCAIGRVVLYSIELKAVYFVAATLNALFIVRREVVAHRLNAELADHSCLEGNRHMQVGDHLDVSSRVGAHHKILLYI